MYTYTCMCADKQTHMWELHVESGILGDKRLTSILIGKMSLLVLSLKPAQQHMGYIYQYIAISCEKKKLYWFIYAKHKLVWKQTKTKRFSFVHGRNGKCLNSKRCGIGMPINIVLYIRTCQSGSLNFFISMPLSLYLFVPSFQHWHIFYSSVYVLCTCVCVCVFMYAKWCDGKSIDWSPIGVFWLIHHWNSSKCVCVFFLYHILLY